MSDSELTKALIEASDRAIDRLDGEIKDLQESSNEDAEQDIEDLMRGQEFHQQVKENGKRGV